MLSRYLGAESDNPKNEIKIKAYETIINILKSLS
jgi:hypothetical protein